MDGASVSGDSAGAAVTGQVIWWCHLVFSGG